jgi:hypothetical protein
MTCPRRTIFGIKLWVRHRWYELGWHFYPLAYGEGYVEYVCVDCQEYKQEQFAGGP